LQNPEDLIGIAIGLASEDSAQITGQSNFVDGGNIIRSGGRKLSSKPYKIERRNI